MFFNNKIQPVIYVDISVAIEPFPIDKQNVSSNVEGVFKSTI